MLSPPPLLVILTMSQRVALTVGLIDGWLGTQHTQTTRLLAYLVLALAGYLAGFHG